MSDEKKKNLIIPIIILAVFYIITAGVLYFMGKTDFRYHEVYWHELMYPRKGAEYVGLAGFILMIIFVILAQVLLIRHLNKTKKIIANILVIFLFFFTLEASIRWYVRNFPFGYRPHPYLIYERVGGHEINKIGIRDEDIPIEKEKGEFRILLVGDSSTEGVGVQMGKRYSDILENKLDAAFPGRKVRVINAGIAGYTSFSIVRLYETRLKKYNPDALIIAINNDCSRDSICSKDRVGSKAMLPLFNLLYKSELYLLLRKVTVRYKVKMLDKQLEIAQKRDPNAGKLAVPPEDVRKNYLEMINSFKEKKGDTIVVVMPRKYEHWKWVPDLKKYIKLKKEIAEEAGTLYVNFYEEWKEEPNQEDLFIDDLHPNDKGNKMIADRLFQLIMEKGLKGLNK